MSLISVRDKSQWSVVLKDANTNSLVLYDNSNQKLSLIHDPILFEEFQSELQLFNRGRLDSSGERGLIVGANIRRNAHPQLRDICSECGQLLNSNGNHDNNASFTDPRYFKLLQDSRNPVISEPEELEGADDGRLPANGSPGPSNSTNRYSSISKSAFMPGYFDKFFVSKALLGRGGRGSVYLVEHILDGVSLGLFALKKVPVGDDHQWLEKVLQEVHLLRLLSHPNLVSYNHVWLENSSVTQFAPKVPCAFILQQYCDGGTLEEYIRRIQTVAINGDAKLRKERKRRRSLGFSTTSSSASQVASDAIISARLTVTEILKFMIDITLGVQHLHLNQIIHRDLKPSNCLIITSQTAGKLPTILVSDFGEGQHEGLLRAGTGTTGTLEYCAPELLNPIHGVLPEFSKKTDIYSLGVILHYLCYSQLPYNSPEAVNAQDIDNIQDEIRNFRGFDVEHLPCAGRKDLPPEIYFLLETMLSITPSARPSADEILEILSQTKANLENKDSETPATDQMIVRKRTLADEDIDNSVNDTNKINKVGNANKFTLPSLFPFSFPSRFGIPGSHLALKASLLVIKGLTLSLISNRTVAEVLTLFIGIEIPCKSLSTTVSLFALHFCGLAVDKYLNRGLLSSSLD